MRIARWTFRTAGTFGLIVMVPMLFVEKLIEQIMPPAVNHPEFFYGFVILNICWQILYFYLAKDPIRFRPMMIPSFFAKVSGPVALVWLYLQGRISSQWITTTVLDGVFAGLFLVSFWATGQEATNN
ncbi:MAG: hypothetical protein H6667_11670 [Ardenticatenaceae bacterium]|nr:hypothetical protein [Ardenticatenaceae bacterium]